MIRPSSILLHLDSLDCPSLRLIEFMNQFRHLPLPEALAPDGIPTLLWKHFKLELGPILYGDIRRHYILYIFSLLINSVFVFGVRDFFRIMEMYFYRCIA